MSMNGRKVEQLAPDVIVGRMIEGNLQVEISVRSGLIVLGYSRRDTKAGVEVVFSPKAIDQFNDHLATAARVARGQG